MADRRQAAEAAARIVVESGAIYVRTSGDPFFFSSGWASPIFIDVKRLVSLTAARDRLIALYLEGIASEVGVDTFDTVAGCELAGVPFAAIIADRLKRPLVVVRKQSKGFGRLAQFEGTFEPGARCLLIDDLSTDGINKATFRAALKRAEAEVVATFVLLSYDIFPAGEPVTSLMTLGDVIRAAEAAGDWDHRTLAEIKTFAANAPAWSKRNGGISTIQR